MFIGNPITEILPYVVGVFAVAVGLVWFVNSKYLPRFEQWLEKKAAQWL